VIELRLISEDMRVGVGRDGKIPLAHLLSDSRPRHAYEVHERDPPVTQVVRRERRHAACHTRPRDGGSKPVDAEALEDAPLRCSVVARTQREHGLEHFPRHVDLPAVPSLRHRA
jgi:hypothetical protein